MASFDEFVKGAPPAGGEVTFDSFAKPKKKGVRTQDDLPRASSIKEMMKDVVTPPEAPDQPEVDTTGLGLRERFALGAGRFLDRSIRKAGETTANIVSAADLVPGYGAMILGTAADLGSRSIGYQAQLFGSGETRREVAQGGVRANERVMKGLENVGLVNPFQRLNQLARGGRDPIQSDVADVMEGYSSLEQRTGPIIEEATGGRVLAEDYSTANRLAMLALPPALANMKAKPKPTEMPAVFRPNERGETPAMIRPNERGGPDTGLPIKGPTMGLQDFLDKTLTRGESSPTERQIREANARGAFDKLAEQEAAKAASEAQWQATFDAERQARAQGKQAREAAQVARAKEEALISELPTTQSDILRIMQKPGWERTAEDLVALREARNKALAVGGTAIALGSLAALSEEDSVGPASAMFLLAAPALRNRAELALKHGVSREKIWQNLGLWKDPGGNWVKEVSDAGAKLDPNLPRNQFSKDLISLEGRPWGQPPLKLREVVDHPELYAERPELADIPVRGTGLNFGIEGAFDPKNNWIMLGGGRPDDALSTALHEIQHALQTGEQRPTGGNPGMFLPKSHAGRVKRVNEILAKAKEPLEAGGKEIGLDYFNTYAMLDAFKRLQSDPTVVKSRYLAPYIELMKRFPQETAQFLRAMATQEKLGARDKAAYEQYKRIMGEAEARLVQARQALTPDERRARPPWLDYDVPEGELIQAPQQGNAPSIAAAVKEKGGMWHPEAVQRLASPLQDKLLAPSDAARWSNEHPNTLHPVDAWAEKAVRNWLNKHAGTATDPLKDIEIPFGEGTKRWEEVTDRAFKSYPAREELRRQDVQPEGRVPPDEQIWKPGDHIFDNRIDTSSLSALTSYLSHVGDYLRQNVPADKLPQYDLVRAVKETAANDARMAKEAAKAAQAEMADLPVHKAYPDGFKWVELKLPEKLTPEQARGVRPESFETWLARMDRNGRLQRDHTRADQQELWADSVRFGYDIHYEALDAKGKPIENSYTREPATGRTPEEAWLAGQLAREGNRMGHCVGGYCEGVAAGESKIFSLRDPKGESHVTVEVEPPFTFNQLPEHLQAEVHKRVAAELGTAEGWPTSNSPNYTAYAARVGQIIKEPRYQEALRDAPGDIAQIKGKQNRAPAEAYLPYVQDFVKSGKWGEVGDVENTGLTRRAELSADERLEAREMGLGDHKYYTPAEMEKIRQAVTDAVLPELAEPPPRGPRGQRGSADPELLKSIAAIGGGAALMAAVDPDSRKSAAALAGLLPLGLVRRGKTAGLKALDKGLGLVSTRTLNMSKELHRRWMDFEHGNLERSSAMRQAADSFLIRLNELPGSVKGVLSRAILTGDKTITDRVIASIGDAQLSAGWQATRKMLDATGATLSAMGRIHKVTEDYYPRIVKDREGLLAKVAELSGKQGMQMRTQLESLILEAEARALKNRGTGLTQLEESKIINNFLLTPPRQGSQPGWAKSRRIQEITEALEPYYLNPTDSLHSYIRSAAMEIEKSKFFGKDAQLVKVGNQQHINIEPSIGNVVQRLLDAKKITQAQAIELREMLQARFGPGERASTAGTQGLRNVTNALLLGNPLTALVQFADVATAIGLHGMMPTLGAVSQILTGNAKIKPRDISLINHISEEFLTTGKTAKFLQWALRWSGFNFVDTFGKTVHLQSALNKLSKEAQTPEGQARLAAKYSEAYGADMPQILADLKAGKTTPLVRGVLFGELSRAQPISKMEMTQKWLENPDSGIGFIPIDARSMYQLKSFMLKQADLIRRESYNEIKRGNTSRGLVNLAKYGLLLGASGATMDMVKDFFLGKPFDAKWSDIPMNLLKTFGWSQYAMDKAKKEPIKAVAGMVIPPYEMYEELLRRDPKALRYLPLIGKVLFSEEWTAEGKARGQEQRFKSQLRDIDRAVKPVFGKPNEAQLEEIKERKRLLRELRR